MAPWFRGISHSVFLGPVRSARRKRSPPTPCPHRYPTAIAWYSSKVEVIIVTHEASTLRKIATIARDVATV